MGAASSRPGQEAAPTQVRNRESLEYLHHHWALPDTFDPADGGSGVRGKVVSAFGRLTYRVLGRYLREERELLSHLVRVNEALEQRCDELTSAASSSTRTWSADRWPKPTTRPSCPCGST